MIPNDWKKLKWGELAPSSYTDIPGYCKSSTVDEIRQQGYVLTPGRYVGAAEAEEEDEPFEQMLGRLTSNLEKQFEESHRLEQLIKDNVKRINVP